jgi:hypothetical protein
MNVTTWTFYGRVYVLSFGHRLIIYLLYMVGCTVSLCWCSAIRNRPGSRHQNWTVRILWNYHCSWGTNVRGFRGSPLPTNLHPHEPFSFPVNNFMYTPELYTLCKLPTKLRPHEPVKVWLPTNIDPRELKWFHSITFKLTYRTKFSFCFWLLNHYVCWLMYRFAFQSNHPWYKGHVQFRSFQPKTLQGQNHHCQVLSW